jgi:hypothetical protein
MPYEFVKLQKLKDDPKKYMVVLKQKVKGVDKEKIIKFGQAGADDYTITKDDEQKKLYIARHQKNENWTKSGIATAGFYAKHILWSEPTIKASLEKMKKEYF